MAWRSILISQPARLAVKNRQLLLEQDMGLSATIPLEDIAVVVLETPQATITSALLAELAAHDVAVITCDETHHPNGVLLPYLPHSRAFKVMQQQLALTLPQKKRAWQGVIQQKIRNQAFCLDVFKPQAGRFLRDQAERVRSGDPDNREASSARYYFIELFGDEFTRDKPCWQNSALNYGYAIFRAAIARSLVCYGFLPAFGLQHHNQLNTFNLADDFIEPLRPVVDVWVRQQNTTSSELSSTDKAALIQLLYTDVNMPYGAMNVLSAIDHMAQCFGRFCSTGDLNELAWPKLA
ncbi:type II CRISPR-associated endonuclease Cas1 [Deefgea piscis]|uniref:Type II CRISPR-associated endonuclease Cas1 n=1 Tax=Deefgea piscis TaxID=2739061 RepID=A0A6M8SXL1_9NEIS|nr:type II CRISPR-associated endonuclease Cas1 [Deefgea piscis]QKJ67319.1 type II CRISPR-associated endonuclease Cas1 [Deefgea piscis]